MVPLVYSAHEEHQQKFLSSTFAVCWHKETEGKRVLSCLTLSPQSFPGISDTFHGNTSCARDSSRLKRGFSRCPEVVILVTRFLLSALRIIFCLFLTKKLDLLLAWWNVDVVLRCLNQRLGYSHICSVLPQPPFKCIICFIKYSTLRKICRMGP